MYRYLIKILKDLLDCNDFNDFCRKYFNIESPDELCPLYENRCKIFTKINDLICRGELHIFSKVDIDDNTYCYTMNFSNNDLTLLCITKHNGKTVPFTLTLSNPCLDVFDKTFRFYFGACRCSLRGVIYVLIDMCRKREKIRTDSLYII